MEESCNTTSGNPAKTQVFVQDVTFVACFILLLLILTLGSSSNIIGLVRIFLVPETLKNFATTVHLLFISTAVCLFMGTLDLVQLISNYFQLGLYFPCHLKMFLHLVLGGATTTTTIAIAWERLLKIKQKTIKGGLNKCVLFSLLWVFVLPYAFYIFFVGVNSDVPSLLIQVCMADLRQPMNTEVFHSFFLPLLYLFTLGAMVVIYSSTCLTVKRKMRMKRRKAPRKTIFGSPTMETVPDSTSSAAARKSPDCKVKNGLEVQKKNRNCIDEKDPNSSFIQEMRTQGQNLSSTCKLFQADHLKTNNGLSSIKENETTADANPTKSMSKEIVLNPLRHSRTSASGAWKTVRDAIASNNLRHNSPEVNRNIVKKLRPELFKTDSSFSLFSEAVLFEKKDMAEVKQKRMLKRTRSQKWMLANISCDLEKSPAMADCSSNADDDINTGTTSPFSQMSLADKRKLFRKTKSIYSINDDSVIEFETCCDIQDGYEENLPEKAEKDGSNKVDEESIIRINVPSTSSVQDEASTNEGQEQIVPFGTPTIRITRPSNDHGTDDMNRGRSPDPSTDTMSISLSPFLNNRSASNCGSYMSYLSSHYASSNVWTHDLFTQVVKRSFLLVGMFVVCFLPICVLHLFATLLSPTTLLNVHPFACCIEQLYHVSLPFLYVFTNKSLKDHLYKWQA